jgi:hypothetical protein
MKNQYILFGIAMWLSGLVIVSHERLLIKTLMMLGVWTCVAIYQLYDMFTETSLFGAVCLSMLCLSNGNFQSLSTVLLVLSASACLYSLTLYIPMEQLLRIVAMVFVYAYILMFTVLVCGSVDQFVFAVYMNVLFLSWHAIVRGHTPLRLLLQ